MRRDQIDLVQLSFGRAKPLTEKIARDFYSRLFALDPSLRAMFKSDMRQQQAALLGILNFAVSKLHCADALTPALRKLGRDHVGYGVVEAHYDLVGRALLETLRDNAGDGWSDELEEAWLAAYAMLADVMKAEAARVVMVE